jgi:hypothetical protein
MTDENNTEDTPVDTIATLAEALASALGDVRTAIALGQRLDGRSLCGASQSIRALLPLVTDALASEDQGFRYAIAELESNDAG